MEILIFSYMHHSKQQFSPSSQIEPETEAESEPLDIILNDITTKVYLFLKLKNFDYFLHFINGHLIT